jgi:hypothetical protein
METLFYSVIYHRRCIFVDKKSNHFQHASLLVKNNFESGEGDRQIFLPLLAWEEMGQSVFWEVRINQINVGKGAGGGGGHPNKAL